MMSTRVYRQALLAVAMMFLGACSHRMEPAQHALGDIEVVVGAASSDAAKYVPDQLAVVQGQLDVLRSSFEQKDYAAVLAGAPAVLSLAERLAATAFARKVEVTKALDEQWAALASVLPDYETAIRGRLDLLGQKSRKPLAAGTNLDAAERSFGSDASLWSKAQAAFAAGNMQEAVSTAQRVKADLEVLASDLKVNLAAITAAPTT
jgi:hypothetical protein